MATNNGSSSGGDRRPANGRPAGVRKPKARTATNSRAAGNRTGANQRKTANNSGPPTLTRAHINGFFAGAIAGVFAGVGGYAYLTNPGITAQVTHVDTANQETMSKASSRRWDFFTVLPNQQLDLGGDVEPAELPNSNTSALYVLQAGSFRDTDDADRRRGELALLGLESQIEEARGENGLWYRVSIGPFESRSLMARARALTEQGGIDTLLLKRSNGE
mgnify:CR=1 FL=1